MKVYDWNNERKKRGLPPVGGPQAPSETDRQILSIREYLDKLTGTVLDLDKELQELRRDYSLLITRIRSLARREGP